jgi:hypothetical protein
MRSEFTRGPITGKQSIQCVSLLKIVWIMEMTHSWGSDWRAHSAHIGTDQGGFVGRPAMKEGKD